MQLLLVQVNCVLEGGEVCVCECVREWVWEGGEVCVCKGVGGGGRGSVCVRKGVQSVHRRSV